MYEEENAPAATDLPEAQHGISAADAPIAQDFANQVPDDTGPDDELGAAPQHLQAMHTALMQDCTNVLLSEFGELAKEYADAPKSANELLALAEGPSIMGYIKRGLSLAEAYTIACAPRMLEKARRAARQEAISGIYAKSHLAPLGGSVADEITVPEDVMRVYRAMFPKMKDAEIRAEYKKQSGK